jgi:hypothetical protein
LLTEDRRKVLQALAALPRHQREALVLRFCQCRAVFACPAGSFRLSGGQPNGGWLVQ